MAVLVGLFLFDRLFAWRFGSARWFAIPRVCKFSRGLTSLNALGTCFVDPLYCADANKYDDASAFGPSSPWPILVTNTVHVYHMIGGSFQVLTTFIVSFCVSCVYTTAACNGFFQFSFPLSTLRTK